MIKKEFSIIIPIKNRTSIFVDYEQIPLRVLQRNSLVLSNLNKKEIKVTKDGKLILTLLLTFLDSLTKIKHIDENIEIVLVDFDSDDYDLTKLEKIYSELTFVIIKEKSHFSRGRGLNIGYRVSTKENIFFCDADMLLESHELFDVAYIELEKNKVLFPICFGLCEPSHQIGYWRNKGYGMCLVNRKILVDKKFYWEEYDSLGKEDEDFWNFFNKFDICSRKKINGYYHQWHPESQEFKNKYYKYNDITKKKVFLNFPENLFDSYEKDIILKENGFVNDEYIVHKLEKFVTSVISLKKGLKIVSDDEINDYKEKHNKKLVNIIIDYEPIYETDSFL